jgi:hypothetical protein
MRMNRKAVTDLPIKLLIISVILSVSLPIIADSLDTGISGMDRSQMDSESQRIAGAAASSYYSTEGDGKYLEISIPEGCYLVLGGEGTDSYGIHMYRGSEEISTYWMEKPMIPFVGTTILEGSGMIRVSADTSGIRVGTV